MVSFKRWPGTKGCLDTAYRWNRKNRRGVFKPPTGSVVMTVNADGLRVSFPVNTVFQMKQGVDRVKEMGADDV